VTGFDLNTRCLRFGITEAAAAYGFLVSQVSANGFYEVIARSTVLSTPIVEIVKEQE
jgi:hypothetical protein